MHAFILHPVAVKPRSVSICQPCISPQGVLMSVCFKWSKFGCWDLMCVRWTMDGAPCVHFWSVCCGMITVSCVQLPLSGATPQGGVLQTCAMQGGVRACQQQLAVTCCNVQWAGRPTVDGGVGGDGGVEQVLVWRCMSKPLQQCQALCCCCGECCVPATDGTH